MGGLICQVASALRSGKISGLILLCSAPPKGVSLHKDLDYTMKILRYLPKLLFKKPFKPSFEIASRYIMNRIPEEKRWGLYEAMVCESGRAAYEIASGKIEVNEAAITCPVYVIGCAEDRIIPPEVARDLFKKYSSISGKSKRTIFYGHGHWPHYEKGWETTAQVIHEWIESISA
jgi:pimeloyl-ACP methyl ester carboxylesterase